jgi:glycosyltransferase involved in cell wall biosynthesis
LAKKHIAIVSNTFWTIYNFRLEIILSLLEKGFDVTTISWDDGYQNKLENVGCKTINLQIKSSSLNPLDDFQLFRNLKSIYEKTNPDVVLHFTIKPVIYGSLTAAKLDIPTINNIAGLGTIFTQFTWKSKVVMQLYKWSQKKVDRVFFQNKEDLDLFVSSKLVSARQAYKINGSGVDISRFNPTHKISKTNSNEVTFLFTGRILREKGIFEYVRAARLINQLYPQAKFWVLGIVGFDNPSAVTQEDIEVWESEGTIKFLGRTDDVVQVLKDTDCVVLPSYYREGVPRSLIEAAAMAIPIITTDHIGCRDIVTHDYNGFLVEKRNVNSLFNAMEKFLKLSTSAREKMGENGRTKVEAEFNVENITYTYLQEIQNLIQN